MKAAVVYESMFGNTKMIAEAVADGLAQAGAVPEVVVVSVTEAMPVDLADLDLLVVGGPTHLRQMTSRSDPGDAGRVSGHPTLGGERRA